MAPRQKGKRDVLGNYAGKSLHNWEIGYIYSLEVKHKTRGRLTVVTRHKDGKKRRPVVVSEVILLKVVHDLVPNPQCGIAKHLALFSGFEGKAFLLEDRLKPLHRRAITLTNRQELKEIVERWSKEPAFCWAPARVGR